MGRRATTWTTPLRPATGEPRGRVLAVPHAGAGPHALLPLLGRLPADVDVVGVTLPGRETRAAEPFHALASDPAAVVAAVLADLAALPPRTTVLFGHSLGAALAAGLATARPGAFEHVVLSAHPSAGTPAWRAGRWSDDDLIGILRRGGETPDEVLRSPTWRRHVLDRLRVDLTLGVRLAHVHADLAIEVPVTLLAGDDDDVAPPIDLATWQARAVAGLRVRTFPGSHFFLLDQDNTAAMTAELDEPFRVAPSGSRGAVSDRR